MANLSQPYLKRFPFLKSYKDVMRCKQIILFQIFRNCTRFTMCQHVLPIVLILMKLKLTSTKTCANCAELILTL
jgi:hypothetical protein